MLISFEGISYHRLFPGSRNAHFVAMAHIFPYTGQIHLLLFHITVKIILLNMILSFIHEKLFLGISVIQNNRCVSVKMCTLERLTTCSHKTVKRQTPQTHLMSNKIQVDLYSIILLCNFQIESYSFMWL